LVLGVTMYTRQKNGTSGIDRIPSRTFFHAGSDWRNPISGPYQMLVKCCWQFG